MVKLIIHFSTRNAMKPTRFQKLGYVITPGNKNIVIQEENLYEIRNRKITVMIWLQLALNL
jgi:hypothetical protein